MTHCVVVEGSHTYMLTFIHIHKYIQYIHMNIHIAGSYITYIEHVYIHTHTHTHTHTHIYIYYAYVHTTLSPQHIYIAHMFIHTYMYIHAYTYI